MEGRGLEALFAGRPVIRKKRKEMLVLEGSREYVMLFSEKLGV